MQLKQTKNKLELLNLLAKSNPKQLQWRKKNIFLMIVCLHFWNDLASITLWTGDSSLENAKMNYNIWHWKTCPFK